LKANVGEVLANGLTAVVLKQPEDSVEFLGRWLLKYVTNARETEAAETLAAKQAAEDAKLEADTKAAAEAAAIKASAEQKAAADKIKDLEDYLEKSESFDGLQEGFLTKLSGIIGSDAVYLGERKKIEGAPAGGDDEEGSTPATEELKYVAATPSHEFLLGKSLLNNQGCTFKIFEEKTAEGEEGDEEGATKEAEPVDEHPHVYIPNVMMGDGSDKMHFWKLPNLGAYFSCAIKYDSCLNESTLDYIEEKETEMLEAKAAEEAEIKAKADAEAAEAAAAAAAENEGDEAAGEGEGDEGTEEPEETEEEKTAREEKEAKETAAANEVYIIAKVPKVTQEFALCLDTLGQSRRLEDNEIALVKKFAALYKATCLRLDRNIFTTERLKRKSLNEKDAETVELNDDEVAAEKERISQTLERQGQPNTEKDVNFQYIKGQVNTLREQIAEFKTYNVFKGHTEVILALLYMLNYKKEDLMGPNKTPEWKKIRVCFNDELFMAITNYEPRDQQLREKSQNYATVKGLQKLLGGLTREAVASRNKRVGAMFDYVTAAIEVKAQGRQERIEAKIKAEEEAKAAAEAAAKLAEEEAAAAAAALAEGEAAPAAE